MRRGSTSTWISRSNPPVTAASATPSSCSKRLRKTDSAASLVAQRSVLPATEMAMMGSDSGSTRRIRGRLAVSGRLSRMLSNRSRTLSMAKSMSVPQAKRRVTRLTPSLETEVTRSTPGTAAPWASTRSVTSRSTSAGATSG